jgi:hypothetical protein
LYSNRRKETSNDNGIIYPLLEIIIKILQFLNIVEWLKKLSDYLTNQYFKTRSNTTRWYKVRRNRNVVIDIFIIVKFIFIILAMYKKYDNIWIQITVWYLLVSNVFTYFYYHLWYDDALLETHQTVHRVRRRFINLIISVIFMIGCYAYFYLIFIPDYFTTDKNNEIVVSILNSICKSFAIDFDDIKAKTTLGAIIEISQVVNTFIFITILLAKSLPKANQK